MATPATPKPKLIVRFETPSGVPELSAAASLTIALVKFLQCTTLDEVMSKSAPEMFEKQKPVFVTRLSQIELSDEQVRLLEWYQPVLRLITTKPNSTLAVCPSCFGAPTSAPEGQVPMPHGWQLVGSTAPSSCRVTAGCKGKPVRASAATKVEVRSDEPEPTEPQDEPETEPQLELDLTPPSEDLVDFEADDLTAPIGVLVDFD